MEIKVNLLYLPLELKRGARELLGQLNFIEDDLGVIVKAKKGEKFKVEKTGNEYSVTYAFPVQFYRALLILAREGTEDDYSFEYTVNADELGVMIDCSRNAVKTVEHIKDILRHLALLGYNQIGLYMEDTFKVDGEDYFGYLRGRYSHEELKEIDDYATLFGIEVVPFVQTLAHLERIFQWPEYKQCNDIANILLIDEPRTYTLIDNIFASLSKCFRSKKVHIGLDEAHLVGRGAYYDRFGAEKERSALILRHLERIIDIANNYGKSVMMWSDMFFRLAFGGRYYVDNDEEIPQEVLQKVPKNLRLVYWDYASKDYNRYDRMFKKHKKFGVEVGFAGSTWSFTGFAPHNDNAIATLTPALKSAQENSVRNIVLTLWGDDGGEYSVFGSLPSICFASEWAYSEEEKIEKTFYSLTNIKIKDFMTLDLPNIVGDGLEPNECNRSKAMLYNDLLLGHWNFAGKISDNEIYAKHTKKINTVSKICDKYAYLFRTQSALCSVLSIKYDLPLRLRKAYQEGNKEQVELCLREMKKLPKKIEKFYEFFKEQWEKENKPFGFEVQDIRLGGLKKRVEHCIVRIKDYLDGKTDSIPELEEELLVPYPTLATTGAHNNFALTVTSGKI